MKSRDWMNRAECRKHPAEVFFPEKPGIHGAKQAMQAIAICRACPVIAECGQYQRDTDSGFGVWAGTMHRTAGLGISEGGPRPMRRPA